jgi:hypothetical protein
MYVRRNIYTLIVLFFLVLKVHLTMQILFVNEDKRTIINNIVSKLQNYIIRLLHCPKKKKYQFVTSIMVVLRKLKYLCSYVHLSYHLIYCLKRKLLTKNTILIKILYFQNTINFAAEREHALVTYISY